MLATKVCHIYVAVCVNAVLRRLHFVHLPIGSNQIYSVPVQISMSVRWTMTVMAMLTAVIQLAVMSAVAGADMREMVSTAQVILPCPISFSMNRHTKTDLSTWKFLVASASKIKFHMC